MNLNVALGVLGVPQEGTVPRLLKWNLLQDPWQEGWFKGGRISSKLDEFV